MSASNLVQCKGHHEIVDGMHFIKECITAPPLDDDEVEADDTLDGWYVEGEDLHVSQNAYLVDGEETLLFDTLTPAGREGILENLDELLDGRNLDYLVVSHPEANHAGNAFAIQEAHPEATLVAPERGSHHDLFGIDTGETGSGDGDALLVSHGDTIDLGGFEVEFRDPEFFDHAMTTWMRETTTGTLFTVDFLGFEHLPGDCLSLDDELRTPLTPGRLERFNSYAFTWLRYVDTDRIDEVLDALVALDPDIIAPAHGQVVRERPVEALEMMREAIHEFADLDPEEYHVHTHGMRRGTV